MSTFGQIGAMLSRGAGKDRDIQDMPKRIKNMEEFIRTFQGLLAGAGDQCGGYGGAARAAFMISGTIEV